MSSYIILITFMTLFSDQCAVGFPRNVSTEGEGLESNCNLTTRLIPDLKFGCTGTIVRFTVTVSVLNRESQFGPKIQVWRRNQSHPGGLYYKLDGDILLERGLLSCQVSTGIRERVLVINCVLSEGARISVKPGDILGLELPHTDNRFLDIHFLASDDGPANYIFQQGLSSTVNISEADSVTNHLPQITFLVALGNYIKHALFIVT